MRRKLNWLLALITVILGAAAYVGNIQATPASGFAASTISVGRLPEFDVTHHLVSDKSTTTTPKGTCGCRCRRPRGPQTCMCRATCGRSEGPPAGIRIPDTVSSPSPPAP